MVFEWIFEKIEQMWVLFHILLPFWTFKFLTYLYDVGEKFFSIVLAYHVLNPHGNEANSYVNVHGQSHIPPYFVNGLVFYHKVLILQLNIVFVHITLVAKQFLKVLSVMDGSGVQKDRIVFVEPVIANSLEESLTYIENWKMVLCIA